MGLKKNSTWTRGEKGVLPHYMPFDTGERSLPLVSSPVSNQKKEIQGGEKVGKNTICRNLDASLRKKKERETRC